MGDPDPTALTWLVVACSSNKTNEESVATATAAVTATNTTTVSAWSFTVTLPTWGTLGAVAQALTGTQGVSIGASSSIKTASTNARRAIIASGGPVTIQPDAQIPDVVATGPVDLRDRSKIDGYVVAPTLTKGNDTTITGTEKVPSNPATGDALTWSVSVASGSVPGWDIQPGDTQTISPGRYGSITVKSSAKLVLSAPGRYFFESFDLETGGTLQTAPGDQPTEIYVRQGQLILRGTIAGSAGLEERLAIVYMGTNEVFLEAPLVGGIIAPSAQVALRSTSTPHRGVAFGQTIVMDAGAKLEPIAQPFLVGVSQLPADKCTWAIPPKSTGNKRRDEFQFQYEILRYCVMRDASDDIQRLTGQLNYEAAEGAAAMGTCAIQPSQYLGFVRCRAQQLAAARADANLARQIVQGPDADEDWVPDAQDHCSGTPLLTPVDANGCPTPFPPAPTCASVQGLLNKTGIIFNPACTESAGFMPVVNFAVAVYNGQATSEGVYLYVQELPAQPAGCDPWYEIDIKTVKSGKVIDNFNVYFPNSAVSHVGRVVPTIPQPYVQLSASPSAADAVGRLGKLAQAHASRTVDEVYFRVRAISGIGVHGPWTRWATFMPQDCRTVGFKCW